jgi:translation initiation factor IF-3
VRVIDEEGNQLGIMPVMEALRLARDRGLDLVEVQALAVPPVCRIMDHGRHKYEQEARARESRRQAPPKAAELKEVQLSPVIAEHDLQIRVEQAKKFLAAGSKVRLSVRFKGIHMRHPENGQRVLEKALEQLKEHGALDGTPRMEGRIMSALVVPARARVAATPRRPRPDEAAAAPAGAEARPEAAEPGTPVQGATPSQASAS